MGISQSDMSGLRVQFKSVPEHKMTFLTHRSKPTLGGTPLGSPVSWVQDFNGQGRDNRQANRVTSQKQGPPATRRPTSVLTPAICSPYQMLQNQRSPAPAAPISWPEQGDHEKWQIHRGAGPRSSDKR